MTNSSKFTKEGFRDALKKGVQKVLTAIDFPEILENVTKWMAPAGVAMKSGPPNFSLDSFNPLQLQPGSIEHAEHGGARRAQQGKRTPAAQQTLNA